MMSFAFCFLIPVLIQCSSICSLEQYFDINSYEDLVDRARFGSSQIDVIQTTSRLLLIDTELNVLNITTGPKNASYTCNKVLGYQLSDMFFVACQQVGALPFIQAYKCVDVNCNAFGDTVYIPLGITTFDRAEIVGNTLLILQNDQVIFYTLVISASSWYIRTTSYTLDKSFFNRTSINITDFALKQYQVGSQVTYKILIVDQNDGILWVDAIYKSNNLVPYNYGYYNIRTVLYSLQSTTKFRSVGILFASDDEVQFVVSTVQEDNYQLRAQSSYLYSQAVLARYKDWTQISYFSINGNVVAIPYQNLQGTIVTLLYKATISTNVNLKLIGQNYQDLLISSSMTHYLVYFADNSSVVYKSDTDSLTKCYLSQYNQTTTIQ